MCMWWWGESHSQGVRLTGSVHGQRVKVMGRKTEFILRGQGGGAHSCGLERELCFGNWMPFQGTRSFVGWLA